MCVCACVRVHRTCVYVGVQVFVWTFACSVCVVLFLWRHLLLETDRVANIVSVLRVVVHPFYAPIAIKWLPVYTQLELPPFGWRRDVICSFTNVQAYFYQQSQSYLIHHGQCHGMINMNAYKVQRPIYFTLTKPYFENVQLYKYIHICAICIFKCRPRWFLLFSQYRETTNSML